jgi:phosphotransferase family enzyme
VAGVTSDNVPLEEIKARLSEKLTAYFPELSADPSTLELAAVAQRSYSSLYIFKMLQNGGPGPQPRGLVVKLFTAEGGGLEAAQSQYAALTRTWPLFQSSPTLSIPRPLDFFPEWAALVTEKVPGEPLQQRFKTWPTHKVELLGYNHSAGEWLKRFHDTTVLPAGRMDVESKLQQLQSRLEDLQRLGFSSDLCRQLQKRLSSSGKRIANVDLAMASVHGDFTVDNLLVEGERITAIDLGGRDRNAIYHDVATYLNSLLLIRLSWPVSHSLLDQARDAFLAGYFGGAPYSGLAVQFLRLIGFVNVAVEILHRRRAQPFARWWIRSFFKRTLRRLLEAENI